MGNLEQRTKKRTQRKHLQDVILNTVAGAGILSIGLLAPNVIGAMSKLGLIPNKRQKEYVASSASRMVKKGLLKYNGKFYELTVSGQERLRRWEFSHFKFTKPKRWDEKWRVVIFDIPEKKRIIRDQIRILFKSAGFYLLQESVWVYPYDCEDIIALLKTDFGVGKNLLYLIVEELENDKRLREEFGLV
mgnify:CR=1 FL=1